MPIDIVLDMNIIIKYAVSYNLGTVQFLNLS